MFGSQNPKGPLITVIEVHITYHDGHSVPAPFCITARPMSFLHFAGVPVVLWESGMALKCLLAAPFPSGLQTPELLLLLPGKATFKSLPAAPAKTNEPGSLQTSLCQKPSIKIRRNFSLHLSLALLLGSEPALPMSYEVTCEKGHCPCCSQPSLSMKLRLELLPHPPSPISVSDTCFQKETFLSWGFFQQRNSVLVI